MCFTILGGVHSDLVGKRKHKQAVNKAEEEWNAYQSQLDYKVNEIDMKALEAEIKTLKQDKD